MSDNVINMLIAVYGTLKKAYHNHMTLGDSPMRGYRSYTGLLFHREFFPGAVLASDVGIDHPAHAFVHNYQIACEIYEVDEETLVRLDRLEGHPDHYFRTPMKDDKFGEVHIYTMRAAKFLLGRKKAIPGGYWYGSETTAMEVEFGDGTVKPKIIGWNNSKSQPLQNSQPKIIVPEEKVVHHNQHYYESVFADMKDDLEVDEVQPEIDIDLDQLDQVKEA